MHDENRGPGWPSDQVQQPGSVWPAAQPAQPAPPPPTPMGASAGMSDAQEDGSADAEEGHRAQEHGSAQEDRQEEDGEANDR